MIAGLSAWVIAQIFKLIIYLIVNREFQIERLFGDGGMPSGHSATVTAAAVTTGFVSGFGSPLFAIATILAVIVMHDATGVRRETGKQAKVIKEMASLIVTVSFFLLL